MQTIYQTNRLILSPFSRSLIQETKSNYINWFYDQEITRFNSHGLFPYGKERMENYLDMCESGKEDIVWAIVWNDSRKHIGNVSLQRINHIYGSAEFAIIIGEKEFWNDGIGYEALSLLFKHAFNRLRINRIWSGTSILNVGMISLFKKLNMQQEGVLKQGQFLDGNYEDIVQYAILKEEYDRQTDNK
jgi:[ribosomal protein S5]-alanine N-acetyltransferase